MKRLILFFLILFGLLVTLGATLFVMQEDKTVSKIMFIIGLIGELTSLVLLIITSRRENN